MRAALQREIDVNGISTRYYVAGSGAPMVLVHGGHYGKTSNSVDWELNVPSLSSNFRVHALDKIGMGFTDNPVRDSDYTIDSTVSHLEGFIDALGLPRVHLVGHSRGGYTVARLAIERPDLIDTLTIVSSSTLMTPPNPLYDRWEAEAAKLDSDSAAVRFLANANSFGDRHITDSFVDTALEIQSLEKTAVAREKMNSGLFEKFKEDLVQRQSEIHELIRGGGLVSPTHLVWGFEDPSATMERCGVPAMNLIFSSCRSEVEMTVLGRSGHYCYREQPDAFDSALTSFIERRGSVSA